jgi:hypothetical protein
MTTRLIKHMTFLPRGWEPGDTIPNLDRAVGYLETREFPLDHVREGDIVRVTGCGHLTPPNVQYAVIQRRALMDRAGDGCSSCGCELVAS